MLETCRGPCSLINLIKSASRWFHYTEILWCSVNKQYEIWYLKGFRKSVEKTEVLLNFNKRADNLHEDLRTFMAMSLLILLRIKNIVDKCCKENQIMFYIR
jgi:hypothetical protein